MPAFWILDDQFREIDASVSISEDGIFFEARGGAKGTDGAKNTEYNQGLYLALSRLIEAGCQVKEILVETQKTQALKASERSVLPMKYHEFQIAALAKEIQTRAVKVGQSVNAKGGNSTKRLRIVPANEMSQYDLVCTLCLKPKDELGNSVPAKTLHRVGKEQIDMAALQLRNGRKHRFGEARDYPVDIGDGKWVPSKALFGVALSNVIGEEAGPGSFSGGINSICVKSIKGAGYRTLEQGETIPDNVNVLDNTELEDEFEEGRKVLKTHYARERKPGLARLKKSDFKKRHGGLFCECCEMKPLDIYGEEHGDACIEVHHAETEVSKMTENHKTKLSDLQCLCANCHRIEHSRLRLAAKLEKQV